MKSVILKKAVMLGGLRLIGGGLALLFSMVVARNLGPEGVGAYAYVLMCLGLVAVPVQNGWATMLLRQAAIAAHNANWPLLAGMTNAGRGLAAGIALLFVLVASLIHASYPGVIPPYIGYTGLLVLSLILFADQVSALRLAVLRGLNFPLWGQLPEALVKPALLILFFLMFVVVQDAVSLMSIFYAACLASVCNAVVGVYLLSRKAPASLASATPRYALREWFTSASVLSGSAGLIVLNSYVDVLMLGYLSSLEQVGYYKVAAQIALFSGFVYTALNMLASQRFASLVAKDDRAAMQASAVFMARVSLLGALPLPLLFYAWGDSLIKLGFGEAFSGSLAPLAILFFSQIINVSFGMARTLLVMNGMELFVIRITIASLLVNVVFSYFLIPLYGSVGVAISVLLSAAFWNLMTWLSAVRLLRVDTSVIGLRLAG